MTLREYQKLAFKTALPSTHNLSYMALGLSGEAGEVANKIKKIVRGDAMTNDALFGLPGELGDVLWYIAGLTTVCGFDLDTIAKINLDKLKKRMENSTIQGSGDNR